MHYTILADTGCVMCLFSPANNLLSARLFNDKGRHQKKKLHIVTLALE